MNLRWTSRPALWCALALMALVMLPSACQRPAGESAAPAVEDAGVEADADAEAGAETGETMAETVQDGPASPPDPYGGSAYQVAWHDGSIDEAFTTAQAEDKPVFLYWGAVWCPPCHYLKEKVFKTEAFAEKSRDFVMVELDGDTERAQALGEQFAVMGYPTVIVLDGDRNEIMRMSSGIPVDEYAQVLDAAVAMRRPVGEVLDEVMAVGPEQAPPELMRMLAYYAWGQDDKINLPAGEELATFRALYEGAAADPRTVKARFLTHYLDALISAQSDAADAAEDAGAEPEPVIDEAERAALTEAMTAVLQHPVLRNVALWHVSYWSRETVELLHPEPGPERDALVAAWNDASEAIQNDDGLTVDDRLSGIYPQVELYKLQNPPAPVTEAEDDAAGEGGDEGDAAAEGEAEEEAPPALSAELQDKVRARVRWAAETAKEGGEMQAVMSSMIWLLREAELESEAAALLEASLDKTLAPYYFMSSLSSMAETSEEKIAWRKRAWDESVGPATRFQWGLGYLSTLMSEAPEDAALIESETLAVLDELLVNEDAFQQRNQRRLNSLASALESWNEEAEGAHDAVLTRLRERVTSECERYADAVDEAEDATSAEGEAGDDTAADGDGAQGGAADVEAETDGGEAEADTLYSRCTSWLAPEPAESPNDG